MTLATVQSFRMNWPTMTGNFATRPFCNRTPKTTPVTRPSRRRSGESNMARSLPPVEGQRGDDRGGEEDGGEHQTRHGQLQVVADAVAAGAARGEPRPEHHQQPGQ